MNHKRLLPILTIGLFFLFAQNSYAQNAIIDGDEIGIPINQNQIQPNILAKATSQWSVLPNLPEAKYCHQGAYLDGNIYVFGGVNVNGIFSPNSYKYNIASKTWSRIKDQPGNRAFGVAEAVNGKIYIIGGYKSAANPFSNEPGVLEYDPATDAYTNVTSLPTPVSGCTSCIIGGKIYIIAGSGNGGWSIDYKNLVQVYDPATNQWSTTTPLPYTVRTLACGAIGNTIITVGGYKNDVSPYYKNDVYRGEVSGTTITWTRMPAYPAQGVIRHSGGASTTKAYFTGGQTQLKGDPASPATYAFNLANNTWEVQEDKPTGIQNFGKLIFDGTDKLYHPGGSDKTGVASVSFEVFSTSAALTPNLIMNDKSVLITVKTGTIDSKIITLRNTGGAGLTWSGVIEPASGWVALSQASGVVNASSSGSLSLNFTSTGFNAGKYTAALKLITNDPNNQSINIPVLCFIQNEEIDTEQMVLLEEGTGTWCQYCPYGADSVRATVNRYPGRVIAIAYHGGSAITATTESMYTPATTTWATQVNLAGWPSAAVNRIKFEDQATIAIVDRAQYAIKTREVLATKKSPISLNIVGKQYNPNTKQGSITVEVFFHQAAQSNIRLNIAQLEDGLNWTQVTNVAPYKIYPYYHEHVMRQMLPNDFGEIITTESNLTNNQSKVTKTISFTSKDSVASKSSFVIFAHICDGITFGEVLQSKSITLSSLTEVYEPLSVKDFTLSQNYPNPFSAGSFGNPITNINFSLPVSSHVTIKVTDLLGREIKMLVNGEVEAGQHQVNFDAGTLPSGLYLYTLKAGNFTSSKKMMLMK